MGTFSDALLGRLFSRGVPGYVNRLAYIGSLFSFCLPPSITGQQPLINSSTNNPTFVAFGGSGNKLVSGLREKCEIFIGGPSMVETKMERRERALNAVTQRWSRFNDG